MTEFNTTIHDKEVTIVVTNYEPPIQWSYHEDAWPAHIDYIIYNEDGQEIDPDMTREDKQSIIDAYNEHQCKEFEGNWPHE